MDSKRFRRTRKLGSDLVPETDERIRVRRVSARNHRCRRVHGVASSVGADVSGRPRIRIQVEYGLDARYAGIYAPRSGSPALSSRRTDLFAALRVQRELRAPALA